MGQGGGQVTPVDLLSLLQTCAASTVSIIVVLEIRKCSAAQVDATAPPSDRGWCILQIIYQPYAFAKLHRLHMVSTSWLAATTLGALAMLAYDIQEYTALQQCNIAVAHHHRCATVVVLWNVTFVGWAGAYGSWRLL